MELPTFSLKGVLTKITKLQLPLMTTFIVVAVAMMSMMIRLNSAEYAWVTITNNVGGPITVDCSTKDDDFHSRAIANTQTYVLQYFVPNYWVSTVLWCDFIWQERRALVITWQGPGTQNPNQHPQLWKPCKYCVWDVKADGFYRTEAGPGWVLKLVQLWMYPPTTSTELEEINL